MSRIKNWMMDLEELTCDGIDVGNATENDVVNYVKLNSQVPVDEAFVRSKFREWAGPDGP